MVADTDILSMRDDFEAFLAEMGLTHGDMVLARASIPAPAPHPEYAPIWVVIQKSHIEGLGAFAARDIPTGAVIAPIRVSEGWTQAGRYANHSPTPNMAPVNIGVGTYFVASQLIEAGEELTVNYRQVRDILYGSAKP